MDVLRQYLRLVLESSPSRMNLRMSALDADSAPASHLDSKFEEAEPEEEIPMAQHLLRGEDEEEIDYDDCRGPIPPQEEKTTVFPDPYVRGQYDNVTWAR